MDDQRRQRPFARRSNADTLDTRKVETLEDELRALPELEAPAVLWERVEGRLDASTTKSRASRRSSQRPMALAAAVAAIAVAAALVSIHLSTDGDEPTDATEIATMSSTPVPLDRVAIIESLMEQSQLAEERRRAGLVFYSPSGPERLLREQIGGIDATLNEQMFAGRIEPKFRETLLRDRVELIADLTDIERYRQHELVRQVSF